MNTGVDRKTEITRLYNRGDTLVDIGRSYGISRQRVWQIIKCQPKLKRRCDFDNKWKPHPSKSEIYIAELLRKKGHKVKYNGYAGGYDLLVDKKIRVEVKSRISRGKLNYALFNYLDTRNFDLLICLLGKEKRVYIMPASDVGSSLELPFNPKYRTRKQKMYLNAYSYLNSPQ
jgi:hypothetical protein